MWRVVIGTLFGIYLAQTYKLPNITSKFREIEKYLKENRVIENKDNEDKGDSNET